MTEHERKILASTNAVRIPLATNDKDRKFLNDFVSVVAGAAMAVLFMAMMVILA